MEQEPKKRLSGVSKIDATTEVANELIDKRDRDREAKTERLRALRLAKEEADARERELAKSRSGN